MNYRSSYRYLLVVIFCTLVLTKAGIVSKSRVVLCGQEDVTSSEDEDVTEPQVGQQLCKKKLVVTMTLKNAQANTESLYANIDRVYEDGNEDLGILRRPFRIELSKSAVISSYQVYYYGTANAKPHEKVIWLGRDCEDGFYDKEKKLACGVFKDAQNKRIWDSQGFCCQCSQHDITTAGHGIDQYRGNFSCHHFGGIHSSAHCMRLNDLWYNVFRVSTPLLWYNITIKLFQLDITTDSNNETTEIEWNHVSTIPLSPSTPYGRSPDGRVVVKILGDLANGRSLKDFSSKYLLVPTLKHWEKEELPKQYTNGPDDWLVVDKHEVDISGTRCNKVGAYFSAFKRQPSKCHREAGSCFDNQPLDYWKVDDNLRNHNKTGRFMLYNYGKIHPSTHPDNESFTLRFFETDFHNTLILLQVDASDITFVYTSASGRLVSTYATENFESLKDTGYIYVEVENTGEVTADFSVSVDRCSRGVTKIAAKRVSIDPGQIVTLSFVVQTFYLAGNNYECEIQLYDSDYALIQTALINFQTNSTCLCYGNCGCDCDYGSILDCPYEDLESPPPQSFAKRIVLLILHTLGAHGIVFLLGSTFIILGFVKLSFGRVLFCRKTKSQELIEKMKKEGIVDHKPKDGGPILVKCTGTCRGAIAAKRRYRRKLARLRRMGKKPRHLDDWKNYSYTCNCQFELADIKMINIIKAIFFFYYCLFLPFIWLGKKIIWRFRDTAEVMNKYEKLIMKKAAKKGRQDMYLFEEEATGDMLANPILENINKDVQGTVREEGNVDTGQDSTGKYKSGSKKSKKRSTKDNKYEYAQLDNQEYNEKTGKRRGKYTDKLGNENADTNWTFLEKCVKMQAAEEDEIIYATIKKKHGDGGKHSEEKNKSKLKDDQYEEVSTKADEDKETKPERDKEGDKNKRKKKHNKRTKEENEEVKQLKESKEFKQKKDRRSSKDLGKRNKNITMTVPIGNTSLQDSVASPRGKQATKADGKTRGEEEKYNSTKRTQSKSDLKIPETKFEKSRDKSTEKESSKVKSKSKGETRTEKSTDLSKTKRSKEQLKGRSADYHKQQSSSKGKSPGHSKDRSQSKGRLTGGSKDRSQSRGRSTGASKDRSQSRGRSTGASKDRSQSRGKSSGHSTSCRSRPRSSHHGGQSHMQRHSQRSQQRRRHQMNKSHSARSAHSDHHSSDHLHQSEDHHDDHDHSCHDDENIYDDSRAEHISDHHDDGEESLHQDEPIYETILTPPEEEHDSEVLDSFDSTPPDNSQEFHSNDNEPIYENVGSYEDAEEHLYESLSNFQNKSSQDNSSSGASKHSNTSLNHSQSNSTHKSQSDSNTRSSSSSGTDSNKNISNSESSHSKSGSDASHSSESSSESTSSKTESSTADSSSSSSSPSSSSSSSSSGSSSSSESSSSSNSESSHSESESNSSESEDDIDSEASTVSHSPSDESMSDQDDLSSGHDESISDDDESQSFSGSDNDFDDDFDGDF